GLCNSRSMMRFASILALLVGSLSLSSIAEAAPRHRYYYRDRGYYPDHEGLMFRLAGGLGGVIADDNLNDVTLSGGSGLLSLDLGGSIAPDLALHGRLSINSMFEPNVSESGTDTG